MESTTSRWEWAGVLAGAYAGRGCRSPGRQSASNLVGRRLLCHLVNREMGVVLCGKIDYDRLADIPTSGENKCPTCEKRATKRGLEVV